MLDVLIFPGYGVGYYPTFLFEKEEEIPKFPRNRVGNIIKKIRDAAVCFDYENTKVLIEYLRVHKDAVVKDNDNDDLYYIWNEDLHWMEILQIVSVDNSSLWTIDEYDGAECIYYPKPEIVDKELNYCEVNWVQR